jgi:hypothetical protein
MGAQLPERGYVFWPVGTGDSTTIVVDPDLVFQVDVHHLVCADDDDDPSIPVVDELVRVLPRKNNKPYLAGFALTHPDNDHCLGFGELLKRVTIGELWLTPRIFSEHKGDLVDDAILFQNEAMRRVRATIAAGGNAKSGDRIWIIGSDEVLEQAEFKGFPKSRLTVPGNSIFGLDGQRLHGRFRAFIHAPFKDDCSGDRNDSSLGMQVTLSEGSVHGRALLLGDLCYPTVNRIFKISSSEDLTWNVFLAPHHCSKSVMYWQDEGEASETLKQPLVDEIEKNAGQPGYVVSSSCPVPLSNKPGDNPPHALAKQGYEEIAPDGFLCTMEHPDETSPEAIIFEFGVGGLSYSKPDKVESAKAVDLVGILAAARGTAEPPKDRVGFGR